MTAFPTVLPTHAAFGMYAGMRLRLAEAEGTLELPDAVIAFARELQKDIEAGRMDEATACRYLREVTGIDFDRVSRDYYRATP